MNSSVYQKLIAFHAAKMTYLEGDLAKVIDLLEWLEKVDPNDPVMKLSTMLQDQSRSRREADLVLWRSLYIQVLLKKKYLDCGVDFFGRSWEHIL
jgi:hypothetical protein